MAIRRQRSNRALLLLNTPPGVNGLCTYSGKTSILIVNGRALKLSPLEKMQYLAGLRVNNVVQMQVFPSGKAKYAAERKSGVICLQLQRGNDQLVSRARFISIRMNTYKGAASVDIPLMLSYTTKNFRRIHSYGGSRKNTQRHHAQYHGISPRSALRRGGYWSSPET